MSSAIPPRTGKLAAAARVDGPRSQAAAPSHLRQASPKSDPGFPEPLTGPGIQRIDRAHKPAPQSSPPNEPDREAAQPPEIADRHQAWLSLQASDLIDRLQSWASDLDAREAQLNARTALQDHRERQFRLQQQDVAAELAEQERSAERLREQMQTHARRLAFRERRLASRG